VLKKTAFEEQLAEFKAMSPHANKPRIMSDNAWLVYATIQAENQQKGSGPLTENYVVGGPYSANYLSL